MISIIMPMYNEGTFICDVIASLLNQQGLTMPLELLVIDGMSTDNSAALVREIAARDPRVHLLTNPQRKTPYAFNIGLRAARGEYVGIFGAHAEYAPDYIAVCLDELKTHGAAGCSGKVITKPANGSAQARLVVWVMTNRFAVSGGSFRTQPEGYADTIPYPVFVKQVLLDLGGYNEQLTRNQDNDMNYRIRQAGHTLYYTWRTYSSYYTRPKISGLMQYAAQNGAWCAVNVRIDPRSLNLRYYIPLIFVLALLVGVIVLGAGLLLSNGLITALGALILLIVPLHLLIGLALSIRTLLAEGSWLALLLPFLIFAFHFQYGWNFLKGLFNPPTQLN